MEVPIATPVRNSCPKADPPSVQPIPTPPALAEQSALSSGTPTESVTPPQPGLTDGKTPGKTNRQAGRLCHKVCTVLLRNL